MDHSISDRSVMRVVPLAPAAPRPQQRTTSATLPSEFDLTARLPEFLRVPSLRPNGSLDATLPISRRPIFARFAPASVRYSDRASMSL
jgi:hypothetical protein